MKAFIYTGGAINPDLITERPAREDLRIAADSGFRNAQALGQEVDLLLGDFDSLDVSKIDRKIEILRVPAEKDFTDTQLAVDTALKKGATEIVIIGGLDGRLDHTLSNLAILEDLCEKQVCAVITNGFNRVRFLSSSSTLIAKSGFRYLSLLTLDRVAKGVCIEGCHYPLKNATLKNTFQYAVSNEITENCAFISVRKGRLLIVESAQ